MAYPGYKKWGGGGASGPIYEKWGGCASGLIYEKWGPGGGGGGGGGGALQVRYTKSGGGALQVPYTKSGGGALQVPYTKSGGGALQVPCTKSGGGALQVPYTKSGGGGGAFRFRYLWAHRKYLHVPTYVLPRYTSHARVNESKIHAGKGFLSSIC